MKSRTTTRAASPQFSRKGHCIGVAGPCRWSRDLLVASISRGLRTPTSDLGPVDGELAGRISRAGIELLVADVPSPEGIRVLERIHRIRPLTKVIALSVAGGDGALVPLIRRGVLGIVPPEAAFSELLSDLRLVHRTALACTPRVARMLIRHVGGGASTNSTSDSSGLSPRETEVVRLLEQGLPNKLIADRLRLSEGTVKNHIHRILRKMAVRRRSDITRATLAADP
jgi:DNA-binding NarL/FixJ family response regulator